MAPLQMHHKRVPWVSRTFWATVIDNEKDPYMQGRMQVEFDWEKLDSKVSKRFWVPTVTPYGGLKGSGIGQEGPRRAGDDRGEHDRAPRPALVAECRAP